MKLSELAQSKGTYVGLKLNKESLDNIKDIISEANIPNPTPINKIHSTLIYSRKHLPNFKSKGNLKSPIVAKTKGFDIFPSKDGNVLVILLDSPEMIDRHENIMDIHQATYDYDEFKPHITISYDCGDFVPTNYNLKEKLPQIVFNHEYDEELNLNWANDN